jgi:hypothetical protein
MGGAYSMHHRGEKCIKNFGQKMCCFSAGFPTNLNKESVLTLIDDTYTYSSTEIDLTFPHKYTQQCFKDRICLNQICYSILWLRVMNINS